MDKSAISIESLFNLLITVRDKQEHLELQLKELKQDQRLNDDLPLKKVIEHLGVSKKTFYNYRKKYDVSVIKIGKKIFIAGKELDRLKKMNYSQL
jgi:hypothetical protein